MSAVALIREAAKSGVWVGLNGGNLALKAPAKPPDTLLAKPFSIGICRRTDGTGCLP